MKFDCNKKKRVKCVFKKNPTTIKNKMNNYEKRRRNNKQN